MSLRCVMSANTHKVRVQFDFTQAAVERLDELVDRTGAASRAEVVRRSLELMDQATREGVSVRGTVLRVLF